MAVGEKLSPLDARAKVTGQVAYNATIPHTDPLYVKVLRSPHAHADITRLDTSAALALPGVAAILTANDLPAKGYGIKIQDQPILAHGRVRYVGEPVALVAAETREIAEQAIAQIEVDYQERPAVYNEMAALESGAPALHDDYPDNTFAHAKLRHGDIESGFAQADTVIEETFTSPVAHHAALEPHSVVAQWADDQLTVWSATQAPYPVKKVLAEVLSLDPDQVRVIVPPLGGGYGGKGHIRIEPMAAALAMQVPGRPVKLVLTPYETMVTVTKHAATIRIKTGVNKDGTILARQVTLYWNGGAYADSSPILVASAMPRALGPYRMDAAQVDSYGIYTNLPPAGAFRGAMSSQTTWAFESHMDTLAHAIGMDPLEIRLKNVLHSGDKFATGETMHDVHFDACLQSVVGQLDWENHRLPEGNSTTRYGRGIGVMMKSTIATSRSECDITIDQDGQVRLATSTVEMGQGTHTALAQITADAVGVRAESVAVGIPDTRHTPFDSTTSASRGTSMMGAAAIKGGQSLKQQLIERAVSILEHPTDELSAGDGFVYVTNQPENRAAYGDILKRHNLDELSAHGEHATQHSLDPETGQGVATPHWHQGAGVCEVAVDIQTGKVTVLRYAAASYAGTVINPVLAKLQDDGNVIYGLGPTLYEELIFADGKIVNDTFAGYKIPAFGDLPASLTGQTLESDTDEIHGIGEMTLPPVSPAIANAIFDAVGVRIYDLPLTAENVLRHLTEQNKNG